ncbi:MAG: DUF3833 family protein [Pseudomonadota bacterium]
MRVESFKGAEPRFEVEAYFEGRTEAWGMFVDRFGVLRRQFRVEIDGRAEGEEYALYERFLYDDGEREERTWRVRRIDEHRYTGRAENIVGEAEGAVYGNALNWRYDFDLDIGGKFLRVKFDDWMFLQEGGVMLNRSRITKFGFALGDVFISFSKPAMEQAVVQAAE